MEKTILFNNGSITVKLEEHKDLINYEDLSRVAVGTVLSMVGNLNTAKDEFYGQIYNILADYIYNNASINNELKRDLNILISYWTRFHLNDLHAGTKKQEELLSKYVDLPYKEAVEVLKQYNLYENMGYEYGSAWLYQPMPNSILEEIKAIVDRWS